MKRVTSLKAVAGICLVLLLLAGCGSGGSSDGAGQEGPCRDALISEGEQAPELKLLGPNAEEKVSLQSVAEGRVTLVDVWATWCAPCIEAMPHLEELQQEYEDQGFTVVGVMSDGNASSMGPEWVAEKDLNYPMLYDDNSEALICSWGPFVGYPTLFLLDREGVVVDVFMGTGDIRTIERRVAEVVEGQSASDAAESGDSVGA
jgi:thiol-disulfide isomerase/thioredoxin